MTSNAGIELSRYFGLVQYWVRKFHKKLISVGVEIIDLFDLEQAGFEGLLQARNSFNPSMGTKFSTHASFRIKGAIRDYWRKRDPLSQKERGQVKKLSAVKVELTNTLFREPTIKELAEELRISEREVQKIMSMEVVLISLDLPEESDGRRAVVVLPTSDNTEKTVAAKGLAADTARCLENAITPDEKRVLVFRFYHELTLEEVGDLEGISKDTVRRMQKAAAGKMRRCLEGKEWQLTDIMEIPPGSLSFIKK
jgi:RNA polymerase sigma factor (sigma-70 family)